jgi:hypothetical protein
MRSARTWWTIGFGVVGVALAGALAACSSDSGGGAAAGDAGAGQDSASGDGGATQDSASGDSAGMGDGGTADCGITFHPEPQGSTFCPSVAGDGGDQVCTIGQHCCMPSKLTGMSSNCQATACGGTGMMAPKDWACSSPGSCGANEVCCGVGTVGGAGCTLQVQMFKSTSCKATCDTTEFIVCQATTDCMTGTCEPATAGGAPIGICK